MDIGTLYDAGDGQALVARVHRTTNPWERLRGLLGRAPLAPDEGLILDPCGAIHTLFMRYPIDVVYLRRDLTVTRTIEALAAWRLSIGFGAALTLELAPGGARRAGLAPGRRLAWHRDGSL